MAVTIKHIAKQLQLSVSTVSRALNNSYGVHPTTLTKVQETARELGYIPNLGAKQLVGSRSNLVGIFLPEFHFESNPERNDSAPKLHETLRLYGKDPIHFSVPIYSYRPNMLTEWVRMRGLEGCIVSQPFSGHHEMVKEALKIGVPTVNQGNTIGPQCSLINSDDREGGRIAGRMLLEHGHRRIGYINGPEQLYICRDRYEGLCDAYAEIGLEHDSTLVAVGDFSGESGAKLAVELWKRDPSMTALFCANDLMAMGAIMSLTQAGVRIPEQISVMGYDGTFFTAYTNPPLTTIRHAYDRIGVLTVQMLVELLNGGEGRKEIVAPSLVWRKSVTAAPL